MRRMSAQPMTHAFLVAFALVACLAGCGDSPAETCQKVQQATCPAERPDANGDFGYAENGDTSSCEGALDSDCGDEMQDFIDCLVADPSCCGEPADDGSLDCTFTKCDQAAYGACVGQL